MSSCIIKNTKNKNQIIRSEYDTKYNQTFAIINNTPILSPSQHNRYLDHYDNFRNTSSRVPERHIGYAPISELPLPENNNINSNKHSIYYKFNNVI